MISVVMGTYNRLEMLKAAVASVWKESDEVIVVDGGSTDGTLEWLAGQKILTVRQRELEGACSAFNAGFKLASGDYVAHVNDDDEVAPGTISESVKIFEAEPNVGQIAWAFNVWPGKPDSYGHDTVHGKVYANKGITRRELGDRAHWWTYLFKTYAGDCELSCRIWEMGYEVRKSELRVLDRLAKDELRKENNANMSGKNDSDKFYRIRTKIQSPNARERVLHVALNYGGDNQPALKRALQTLGEYREYSYYGHPDMAGDIIEILDEWDPTLIFMQIQGPHLFTEELGEVLKDRRVVNWSGDVRHPMPAFYEQMAGYGVFMLFTNEAWPEVLRQKGFESAYLQIGFNPEIFHPWGEVAKTPPIVYLGNHYGGQFPKSDARLQMVRHLKDRYGDDVAIHGRGWGPGSQKWLKWEEEAAVYRGCKVAIGMNHLELFRYTSDRMFRAMGSGAYFLAEEYSGIEKDYIAGMELETWRNFDELGEKIDYALGNEDHRSRVAYNGAWDVHRKSTWVEQAYKLRDLLGWHEWM